MRVEITTADGLDKTIATGLDFNGAADAAKVTDSTITQTATGAAVNIGAVNIWRNRDGARRADGSGVFGIRNSSHRRQTATSRAAVKSHAEHLAKAA